MTDWALRNGHAWDIYRVIVPRHVLLALGCVVLAGFCCIMDGACVLIQSLLDAGQAVHAMILGIHIDSKQAKGVQLALSPCCLVRCVFFDDEEWLGFQLGVCAICPVWLVDPASPPKVAEMTSLNAFLPAKPCIADKVLSDTVHRSLAAQRHETYTPPWPIFCAESKLESATTSHRASALIFSCLTMYAATAHPRPGQRPLIVRVQTNHT